MRSGSPQTGQWEGACRRTLGYMHPDIKKIKVHIRKINCQIRSDPNVRNGNRGSSSVVERHLAKVDAEGSSPFSRSAGPLPANGLDWVDVFGDGTQ